MSATEKISAGADPASAGGEIHQDGGPPGSGGWRAHAENMERERDHWRERARTMEDHQRCTVWYWQGDGNDHPESMVNSLPVVIRADQLRALIAGGVQSLSQKKATPASVDKAQAAINSGAAAGPSWWSKRADEIEGQVALTGSPEAMRCYTDMRTLLQAAAGAAPQQEAQEPGEIPESIERMATGRYKVVPSHESMFHRWAVVAGSGTQQLYLGREVECQNMARKFAGAFLDGAFFAMQQPAPQQEAREPVAFRCLHEWDGLIRTSMPPKYACKHCHNFFDAPPSPALQPAPLSDDVFQKTWRLLDELEKLRSANRDEEDWGALNRRDSELRAALAEREGA